MELQDCLRIAETLQRARESSQPVGQFTVSETEFTVEDGYAVQTKLRELDEATGRLDGYKMGLTSVAKQRDVGVEEPICGYLIPGSGILDGGEFSVANCIHPRVEPEIAVRFSTNIPSDDLDAELLVDNIDRVVLGIEVLDSRYRDFKFALADVVADNTSARGWAVGSKSWTGDWDSLVKESLVLKKNGEEVQRGTPAAVLDNPLNSIRLFARMGKRLGFSIHSGMWLLTGGITASVPIAAGDVIRLESSWDQLQFRVL